MRNAPSDDLAARWTALGAMFNVSPAAGAPDLERLLIDTARQAHSHGPQFVLAVTWLAAYGEIVARHRLTRMIAEEMTEEDQPALGLLLESAVQFATRLESHFRGAAARCKPGSLPRPLLAVDCRNEALRKLSEQTASPLSRRWGRWLGEVQLKPDALRPAEWFARRHPGLALRALVGGDLVASILAEAAADPKPFRSEVDLSARCGASRPAVREALAKLRLAGFATTHVVGRRNQIRVTYPPR